MPKPSAKSSLLGRDDERARLTALLDSARAGRAAAVTLVGEPGIGKSALIADVVGRVSDDIRVLRATAIEDAADVPFGALSELIEPLLDLRDRLPDVQAEALDAALALRPPGEGERFAVPSAVLGLLSAAAEQQPVLVVVDDVQWLDGPSAAVLVFAARRLREDGVALLFAARTGEAPAFEAPGIEVVRVEALAPAAARAVAEATADLAPAVVDRIIRTAAGNPLALTELPRLLTRDQRAGRAAVPEPLAPGESVEQAFQGQLAVLPAETRRALVIAAVDPTRGTDALARTLATVGLSLNDLEPAEEAGLIAFEPARVAFRHPLLRSAAYHGVPEEERRAAHGALAAALGAQDPARAWHLAAAADAADEDVAEALETAGRQARERGGSSSAALAFVRAAELTPEPEDQAARLLEAGRDYVSVGDLAAAIAPLERALGLTKDPLRSADAERILANAQIRLGDPEGGLERLAEASARVAEHDTRRAAAMALEAAPALMMLGDMVGVADAGRRAMAQVGPGDEDLAVLARLAEGTGLAGQGRVREARPLLEGTVEAVTVETSAPDAIGISILAAHALLWVEEVDEGLRAVERIIDLGRKRGAPGFLIYPLTVRATGELRQGRLAEAAADTEEAATLADATMALSLTCVARATLAAVEAVRGREAECRAAAAAALELAPWVRGDAGAAVAYAALGQLELSLEHFEQAPGPLRDAMRQADARGLAEAVVPRTIDALEAAYEVDDDATTAHTMALLRQGAQDTGSGWFVLGVARGEALLADGYDLRAFDRATAEARRLGVPLEVARTQLLQGERARWAGQPALAGDPLRRALAGFERIGAARWAERARTELRALGASVQPSEGQAQLDVLSSHELQVARLVSRGMTNREVAGALFLSPKTIEYHLRGIYRKLEIRSRTELAGLMSGARSGATTDA